MFYVSPDILQLLKGAENWDSLPILLDCVDKLGIVDDSCMLSLLFLPEFITPG
jgi:hypothetical protein